ncbi:MAG: SRPBCC domain-containing protein [Gemmatimonadetes bacterium]|nr:SRPBCC domain-containing protein [Gemmatimonadota bacterium]
MTGDTVTENEITRTLELAAEPSRVWRALTEPAELGAWFPDRVEGLEPTAGAEGWLAWDRHGRHAITIEALEPERRLVWRWARASETPLEGGYNTKVEWTLEPGADGGTILNLVESGFRTEADRQENVSGWRAELDELIEYLAS